MANELIINVTPQETRVALLEERALSELYIERTKDRGIVGNVYKGKVMKVLPGMQAAFVDIGLERAAFLYVSDVYGKVEDYEEIGFQGEEMTLYFNPSSPIEDLRPHYTVVVIGSGYGGGIAASRLARAGQQVCVLERGKEFLPGEYPDTELEALPEVQVRLPDQVIGPR